MNLTLNSGAIFSGCKRYRYRLWRTWSTDEPIVNFIMLNPSTADEMENDPTVERCVRRAGMWGYGGMIVTNIFAYKSTDPFYLKQVEDPVGPENDEALLNAAKESALVVCAWGAHGVLNNREADVVKLLRNAGIKIQVLDLTTSGHPVHPLYQRYELWPRPWRLDA